MLSWKGLPLTAFTGQLENLYGFLAFLGVVSFAIIGMLYKILPFLVWYRSYSRHIGAFKIPALADLYSARVQHAGYWTYLSGLAVVSAGILAARPILVQIGCAFLGLSLLLLGVNLSQILKHLIKPALEPLRRTATLPLRPLQPSAQIVTAL